MFDSTEYIEESKNYEVDSIKYNGIYVWFSIMYGWFN